MSVYKILFSPTGGTEKAADYFADAFSSETIPVDLTSFETDFSAYSFCEADICIVAVPSYGGRVPAVAVSRLQQMKGNGAKAVLIVVYGNRDYDDTFTELQDALTEAGFSCIAAVAAIAEHSIMRQFAAGRPDAQDKKELAEFAGILRSRMDSDGSAQSLSDSLSLPGNRPYKAYGGVPMKPQADKSCVGCGLCAAKCPVRAIDPAEPSKTDPNVCISCMRCIAVCPQKARSISKVLLAAGSMKLKKVCSQRKSNELFLP